MRDRIREFGRRFQAKPKGKLYEFASSEDASTVQETLDRYREGVDKVAEVGGEPKKIENTSINMWTAATVFFLNKLDASLVREFAKMAKLMKEGELDKETTAQLLEIAPFLLSGSKAINNVVAFQKILAIDPTDQKAKDDFLKKLKELYPDTVETSERKIGKNIRIVTKTIEDDNYIMFSRMMDIIQTHKEKFNFQNPTSTMESFYNNAAHIHAVMNKISDKMSNLHPERVQMDRLMEQLSEGLLPNEVALDRKFVRSTLFACSAVNPEASALLESAMEQVATDNNWNNPQSWAQAENLLTQWASQIELDIWPKLYDIELAVEKTSYKSMAAKLGANAQEPLDLGKEAKVEESMQEKVAEAAGPTVENKVEAEQDLENPNKPQHNS